MSRLQEPFDFYSIADVVERITNLFFFINFFFSSFCRLICQFSHILAEGEISSTSASGNKKLIIRLWVHDRRTKVTITGRFIRVLFPVEVTGYICVLE